VGYQRVNSGLSVSVPEYMTVSIAFVRMLSMHVPVEFDLRWVMVDMSGKWLCCRNFC
jgi:hypothetical protein